MCLWINLRDRCCDSLSSCCYSLVITISRGGNSPRVHSSCTGTDPVHWTSFAASSPPTTENTVISEGEDVAYIPAQEVTCSHGTDLGASLLSTRSSPWLSGRGFRAQALAWSFLAVPVQILNASTHLRGSVSLSAKRAPPWVTAMGGNNPSTMERAERGPAMLLKLIWAWQPHSRISEFA